MFLIPWLLFLLSWYVGYLVLYRIVPKFPGVFFIAGSYLMGTACVVPFVYSVSCVFASTNQPIVWGSMAAVVLLLVMSFRYKRPVKIALSLSDGIFLVFAIAISCWLMSKTFHGDASGLLYVGSNNIFDFGHTIGLIRSFSFGTNIPFMSPFQSGLPFFYHFFFVFYVGMWEFFGLPLVYAMNIPSVLSFSSLLLIVYALPKLFAKRSHVGWIAALLTVTHPTITFFRYVAEKGMSLATLKELWRIPTYPYSGPFDGSTISIFMTLNNYVNQRHLAFGIALGFVLYAVVWHTLKHAKKISFHTVCVFSVLVGILFYWNMVICGIMALSVFFLFVLYKQTRFGLVFVSLVGVICAFSLIPYLSTIGPSWWFVNYMVSNAISSGNHSAWSFWNYVWENLTLLPVMAGIGYITIKKERRAFLPLGILFIFVCIFAVYHQRGFDQKLLSFSIIPVNTLAAMGLSWFWEKKSKVIKTASVIIFLFLTVSGIVDLLALKNEFAYPLISLENTSVISWIAQNTPKTAVFVSYSDMIDPVVLSGRKNYFGFFGNAGWTDRSLDVKNIYSGDVDLANRLGISYILAPKWNKSDFPYTVDTQYFTEHQLKVYDDEKYSIYSTMIK